MTAAASEHMPPSREVAEQNARVLSFIEAHEARHGEAPEPTYFLCGAEEHDRVELTEDLFQMLKQLVGALAKGQSVQIHARDREITTQQAAEILGLSRPTVVKLIDAGKIAATVPGVSRRKVLLTDVMAYRDELYAARNEFIAESSAAYADVDPEEARQALAEVRKSR
ncbi:excisionase family DNA-binding protein [Nocardioides sp. WG-D5]